MFCRNLDSKRSWVSSSNLSTEEAVRNENNDFGSVPSSWISTPDLANMQDDTQPVTTVNITLPKRKQKQIDSSQRTGKKISKLFLYQNSQFLLLSYSSKTQCIK